MSNHTNLRLMSKIIIAAFILNAIFGLAGAALPKNSFLQIFCWQLGAMSLIAGSTLMTVKLARQNWDIPAAGYTALAIAQGIFYSVLSTEKMIKGEMDVFAFASGVILLFPAMLLISFYKVYPLWLRILGLAVCLPFFVCFYFIFDGLNDTNFFILNGISFGLLQATSVGWSVFIWKELKTMHIKSTPT